MIYLDANAATPLCKEARDAMLEHYALGPMNASSSHTYGQIAKKKLNAARKKVADFIHVEPSEIVFTSGGTESMNLLLRSLLPQGGVLTTDIEHPCVQNTLEAMRVPLYKVKVGPAGQPSVAEIKAALHEGISSLVFSAVNSETGALLDLEAVSDLAAQRGLVLIIDGVALLGKAALSMPKGVSGMGFSGHKIHGPQGSGFCFIKKTAKRYAPYQTGGPQEMNLRAGTENLSAILGMSAALKPRDFNYLTHLRDTFEEGLPFALKNCEGPRIGNTSNLYFEGIDGESLLILLDQNGVMASHGSACSSGALEPSRVLLAMGYSKKRANSSIRFSFHYETTLEEVLRAIDCIKLITSPGASR